MEKEPANFIEPSYANSLRLWHLNELCSEVAHASQDNADSLNVFNQAFAEASDSGIKGMLGEGNMRSTHVKAIIDYSQLTFSLILTEFLRAYTEKNKPGMINLTDTEDEDEVWKSVTTAFMQDEQGLTRTAFEAGRDKAVVDVLKKLEGDISLEMYSHEDFEEIGIEGNYDCAGTDYVLGTRLPGITVNYFFPTQDYDLLDYEDKVNPVISLAVQPL